MADWMRKHIILGGLRQNLFFDLLSRLVNLRPDYYQQSTFFISCFKYYMDISTILYHQNCKNVRSVSKFWHFCLETALDPHLQLHIFGTHDHLVRQRSTSVCTHQWFRHVPFWSRLASWCFHHFVTFCPCIISSSHIIIWFIIHCRNIPNIISTPNFIKTITSYYKHFPPGNNTTLSSATSTHRDNITSSPRWWSKKSTLI